MSRAAVVACGALALDVRRIARRRGWDLEVIPAPALLHNHPERISSTVAELSAGRNVVAVAYGDCGTLGALDGFPRLTGEHCYDLFAREEVAAALDEQPGTYFLTDFLARTFEHTVWRELGLDRFPELRDDYFGNYTRVMWLGPPAPPGRGGRGGAVGGGNGVAPRGWWGRGRGPRATTRGPRRQVSLSTARAVR